jgi:plasmid stability protein
MAAITVRNLSDETHRALKARALAHGRSTEAEVRAILQDAVAPDDQIGLGTRIHRAAVAAGGYELDLPRSKASTEPIDFS